MDYELHRLNKMIRALLKRFDGEKESKQPLLPRDGLQPNHANTDPIEGAS